MIHFKNKLHHISYQISSNVEQIDSVIEISRMFLKLHGLYDSPEFSVVQRELLKNAIYHGNNNDPSKKIIYSLEVKNDNLIHITIEDSGDGFDYEKLNMKLPNDPNNIIQRGYILINAFADSISFNSNGNKVSMEMSMKHIEESNDSCTSKAPALYNDQNKIFQIKETA